MTESAISLPGFKGWCHEHQDKPAYKVVKYTVITIVALAAVALITTSLVGAASLVGGGLLPHTFLGALNTHLTSAWGGLPIFMTAAGSPGYLLTLGLLIYGVYACTRKEAETSRPKTEDRFVVEDDSDDEILAAPARGTSSPQWVDIGDCRTEKNNADRLSVISCFSYNKTEITNYMNNASVITYMDNMNFFTILQFHGDPTVRVYWLRDGAQQSRAFQTISALKQHMGNLMDNKGKRYVSLSDIHRCVVDADTTDRSTLPPLPNPL